MPFLRLTLLFAFTISMVGCDGDPASDPALSDARVVEDSGAAADAYVCTPGARDCPCDDGTCEEGAYCASGTCRASDCPAGDEGCECFADQTCRTGPDGRGMACVDETCRITECEIGTANCPCGALSACDDGLLCQDGRCLELECEPGTLDCICDAGACGGGAACEAGLCVDPGCAPGSEDCVCSNGACSAGFECTDNRCVSACPVGLAGCACNQGLCESGAACLDDQCLLLDCMPGTDDCLCDGDGACEVGRRCTDGRCLLPGCTEGEASCGCEGGNCEAGLQCSALDVCRGCPDGAAGCACDSGACTDGLFCDDTNTCSASNCVEGTEGCACVAGDTCGQNTRGEQMACDGGICVAPSCTPGIAGCPCVEGRICVTPGDTCEGGFCLAPDCAPGSLDCACNAERCEGDLTCRDGAVCVQGEGFVDGPCLLDESCLPGGRCEAGRCAECNLGTVGCACREDGCFGDGECIDELCVDGALIEHAPENPLCYSSCNAGFEDDDGIWRSCDSDGLMSGCVDDRSCVLGTCLEEGQERAPCESDLECPDFQACIAGYCYSDCSDNRDCSDGKECARKVCKAPCRTDIADEGCGAGEYCQTSDGTTGHCVELAPPTGEPQLEVQGTVELSTTALSFSTADTDGTFTITNSALTRATLRVRKASHILYTEDGERLEVLDADDDEACEGAQCPLYWLRMGASGEDVELTQELAFDLEAGASTEIVVEGSGDVNAPRWQGTLEVIHPTLNSSRVLLDHVQTPNGAWTGNVYYFASFGTASLDDWAALPNAAPGTAPADLGGTRDDPAAQEEVGNAFIQRWGAFRRGRIDWREFEAVLVSTQSESWRWSAVVENCPVEACYLYDSNAVGLREYSSDLAGVPVPSGLIELPMTMNLHQPNPADTPTLVTGRIDSKGTLQYAGDPEISITFDGDPTECSRQVGGVCMTYVDSMSAAVAVGGRYETDLTNSNCAEYGDGTFEHHAMPWLLTDFMRNTFVDADTERRYRYSCADTVLEHSSANPVPDGRRRRRVIELVDGALVNQSTLFIIFKERFESFLDPEGDSDGFEAYGYMLLHRMDSTENLTDEDANGTPDMYDGNVVDEARAEPSDLLAVGCDADLVTGILGFGEVVDASTVNPLVSALIEGSLAPDEASYLDDGDTEKPHYLCLDEGTFDGECQAESRVQFFTAQDGTLPDQDLSESACNEDGTCMEQLLDWRDQGMLAQFEAVWRCEDHSSAFCTDDRFDLREGKVFYEVGDATAIGRPIRAKTDAAFRYKTRFSNREGQSLGFAPEECLPESNEIPYCYDPVAVEQVREEVDCLIYLQAEWSAHIDADEQAVLDTYLRENFSETVERNAAGELVTYDGFERSYAELLIMLGDEAITRSYASRFDLAGQNSAAFEGSLLEDGGIDLSGQVGFELYKLYQSIQYYQEALDRFYALSPQIWRAVNNDDSEPSANFVTQETVTRYFDRLVRASSQKTRAWGQVAERYQAFNRPDLARTVIERAYTGAYLESIVFARMMLRVVQEVAPQERAQINVMVDETQRRYQITLQRMRERYTEISDNPSFFGLAPDYIPIPAVDSADFRQNNAVETLLRRVEAKVLVAADREERAIESNRTFDTDAAQFQAELVRIRNTYEDQLASLCGTFADDVGVVYPAISRYADRSEYTSVLGDPCGLVGNGELTQAYGNFETQKVDLERAVQTLRNTHETIKNEAIRAGEQCDRVTDLADFVLEQGEEVRDMETEIAEQRFDLERADRVIAGLNSIAQLAKCSGLDCASGGVAGVALRLAVVGIEINNAVVEQDIIDEQEDIADLNIGTAYAQTLSECDAVTIDSAKVIKDLYLEALLQNIEIGKVQLQIRLNLSEVERLRLRSSRLQQQQVEAEQLQVNSAIARNDPNIRIYRNNAIINADFAYEDAMREAYRLTRVFEYYTSQSYARKDELYFIRLVRRSDNNLEDYITEIRNAFFEFEEEFGLPDSRVLQVSLMNDILAIPRVDSDGDELSDADRTALLRAALADPTRLDENGYISIPFSTQLDDLSPLTHNHKVLFVEAEIIASDFGADHLARLYLRQEGTGVIRSVDGDHQYYRLPVRTAVLNPFFSGVRFFDSSIYRNARLRDRPLVNTAWRLIINQRDELVNQDIDLQSVSDIRLFVYYSDFTADF